MEIIEEDLLSLPLGVNVIAHQANTKNTMGKGIALHIKNKFPQAYEADTEAYKAALKRGEDPENSLLGKFSMTPWLKQPDGRFVKIINLYGQKLYKKCLADSFTDYNAVILGLTSVSRYLSKVSSKTVPVVIGLPYGMGCVNGGGNWNIYEKIIKETLGNIPHKVILAKYSK